MKSSGQFTSAMFATRVAAIIFPVLRSIHTTSENESEDFLWCLSFFLDCFCLSFDWYAKKQSEFYWTSCRVVNIKTFKRTAMFPQAPISLVVAFLMQVITAHKRSLGQGNVFTPVSHSVHRGCLPPCMLDYMPPYADTSPGRHPP